MSKIKFLSIITVHLRDYTRLAVTQKSLQPALDEGHIEWILVDGASSTSDHHEQLLFDKLSKTATVFISEKDEGIYDAMNKGLGLASGEYLLFLNAGDTLHPDFQVTSVKHQVKNSNADMVWGLTQYEYPDGSTGVRKLRGPKWMIYGMPICHQSVLFLRQKFSELRYDTRFKIAADYELLARTLKDGAKVYMFRGLISRYSAGGVSQQDRICSLREEELVRVMHYGLPAGLSKLITGFKYIMSKISDISPAFNRFWRKVI